MQIFLKPVTSHLAAFSHALMAALYVRSLPGVFPSKVSSIFAAKRHWPTFSQALAVALCEKASAWRKCCNDDRSQVAKRQRLPKRNVGRWWTTHRIQIWRLDDLDLITLFDQPWTSLGVPNHGLGIHLSLIMIIITITTDIVSIIIIIIIPGSLHPLTWTSLFVT